MIYELLFYVALPIREIAQSSFWWTLSVVPFFLALFTWRLWTFTLRPLMRPDEVEYLPYWIPCKPSRIARYLE